jgi:hypothetical protein
VMQANALCYKMWHRTDDGHAIGLHVYYTPHSFLLQLQNSLLLHGQHAI